MQIKSAIVLFAVAIGCLSGTSAGAQILVTYGPHSSLDPMTGSATAPLTLTVKRYPNGTNPPQPDTFTTTVTAKDTDEWAAFATNPLQKKFVVTTSLTITSETIEYAPFSGPRLRGNTDGLFTWDFVYVGLVAQNNWPGNNPGAPLKVFHNTFRIKDNQIGLLFDPDVVVTQSIIRPAIPPILP
jgi:hypothetical protein